MLYDRKAVSWQTYRKYTVYDGWSVHHPPLGRFSMVDISTVGIVSVPKRSSLETAITESFGETYRSVLTPPWLLSNRVWKTTPAGRDIHRRRIPYEQTLVDGTLAA